MRKLSLVVLILLWGHLLPAQNAEEAQSYIREGVAQHDLGNYNLALKSYNLALKADKDNLTALGEMALTYLSMGEYEKCMETCRKAIEKHPENKGLDFIYVAYGNALDGLDKGDEAIKIYDEGIKISPNYFQLYYNKGVSLARKSEVEAALACFERAVIENPEHPSSHLAIGKLQGFNKNRIPALLAYSRFLVLEPEGNRAKEAFTALQSIMKGNVEKTGKGSVTINISPDMIEDSTETGKKKENNFQTTDLMLSLSAALDYDKKNKKKSQAEMFIYKMETVCASLSAGADKNSGFYWEYYVPYFIEMKDKKQVETFAYLVFASTQDKDVLKWLKSHSKEINEFYSWSREFVWDK